MASQYATPTAATAAGRENGRRAGRQQEERNVDASGLHAGEHDVKPHGIRRNRTSSAANGARERRVRSSRDGNRGFFRNRPPPDGPRRPCAARLLPAASAPAPDSGTIVRVGDPCLARWPDTLAPPVAATKDGPIPHRLYYSTAKGDETERTTSRIPSADKSAHGRERELAVAAKSNHAGHGPRERQLPTVKSRQRSDYPYSAPGRFGPLASCSSNLSPA